MATAAASSGSNRWQATARELAQQHRRFPTPWSLFQQSVRDYRTNWKPLALIVAVVTIPVALLSNVGVTPSSGTTSSAYLAFAQLAMNAAIIQAVIALRHRRKVTVRQAYYTGSAALVRLVLVAFLLILMSLPLVLGAVIVGFSLAVPAAGQTLPLGEQLLLMLLAVVLSIPSVILLVRAVWSIFIIFETPQGPIEAIRASRKLTHGKTVITLSRLIGLAVLLGLAALVPALLLLVLGSIFGSVVFSILLQILISLWVLPTSNFYLYRYYQELS